MYAHTHENIQESGKRKKQEFVIVMMTKVEKHMRKPSKFQNPEKAEESEALSATEDWAQDKEQKAHVADC